MGYYDIDDYSEEPRYPKRYEIFSQNSELIDVRDTTACFKYNGYIYYTCVLGMGHHYLKIIAES